MVTTRSQSKTKQSRTHQTLAAQGPRGISISNSAPYEASLPYKKRKVIWNRVTVPEPVEYDTLTPNNEQNDEIKLAAVSANLNNRITELKEQLDIVYKLYLTERKKRQYYEHLCRNYETNIHAHQYLDE